MYNRYLRFFLCLKLNFTINSANKYCKLIPFEERFRKIQKDLLLLKSESYKIFLKITLSYFIVSNSPESCPNLPNSSWHLN